MNTSNRRMGLFYVITGATCWGIGGTVAKKLFQEYQIDVNWLERHACLRLECYF